MNGHHVSKAPLLVWAIHDQQPTCQQGIQGKRPGEMDTNDYWPASETKDDAQIWSVTSHSVAAVLEFVPALLSPSFPTRSSALFLSFSHRLLSDSTSQLVTLQEEIQP